MRDEARFIEEIIEMISSELGHIISTVDENLIGIEPCMRNLMSLLKFGSRDIRMVGIIGIGGAGKTTLARAVFDEVSHHFDGTSFVENVTEVSEKFGLQILQKVILSTVLKEEDLKVYSVYEGTQMIRSRLCRLEVLIVLDDVNHVTQLRALAGACNWFGEGSRILITARVEHVLVEYKVEEIYYVDLLNEDEAIQLFSIYAFMKGSPPKEYEEH